MLLPQCSSLLFGHHSFLSLLPICIPQPSTTDLKIVDTHIVTSISRHEQHAIRAFVCPVSLG